MVFFTPAVAAVVVQMAEPVEVETVGNTIKTNAFKLGLMELMDLAEAEAAVETESHMAEKAALAAFTSHGAV